MQILRIDHRSFTLWRSQIEELFNSSVRINFPGYAVCNCYGRDKCDEVAACLKDGTAVVLAAIDQERLMGWVWCHQIRRLDRMRLHIAEIAVSDDCRQQGVGSQLLDRVELYAKENRYQEIDLLVTASNTGAIKFYERALFTPERYLMKKSINTAQDTHAEEK